MANLRHLRIGLLSAALIAAGITGCGDDDDDNGGDDVGGTNSGATNGLGGEGTGLAGTGTGTGGRAGNGGTNPTGGTSDGNSGKGGTLVTQGGVPAVAGAGGAAGDVTGGEAGMSGMSGMSGAGGAAAMELSDAQIVLVLDTLNAGEVEEAYAALPRLSSDDVVAFAQRMITDHSAGRQMVTAAERDLDLKPMPSDVQAKLEQEAGEHVDQFHEGTGALDAAYMQLEIEEHAQALDLLEKLELGADDEALRNLITTLRATVQQHYELAQQVQASL